MNLIISDNSHLGASTALLAALQGRGLHFNHVSVDTLDIRPCTACGSCSGKTYGRCVIADDMQQIFPLIAGCRALVLVSPVVFGGVSHRIKRVMDRMAAVGNPRYRVRGGELVKGMSGQGMAYYMVGIGDQLSDEEQAAFLSLHGENRHIMSAAGRAFILGSHPDAAAMDKIAKELADA